MRTLTRYLLRAHVGPYLFALAVLTGLLFVNTVARNFEELAGKGLPWSVIGEFCLLSLPHILALTLPMSVLVAVLYTFSDLAAENEVTAMAANGVNPVRLLLPLAGVGAILALGLFAFNDRLLPETNHRLKLLLIDIRRKSPTFELREQVVNEIRTEDRRTKYFLQATRIDQATNRLYDVAIYDVSAPDRVRTIYADRGTMAFNRERTDLFLTLYDGVVQQGDPGDPATFQRLFFREYVIPIRGVGDELRRQADTQYRSDREMSTAMLEERAREAEERHREIVGESRRWSLAAVRAALGFPPADDAPPSAGGIRMRTTGGRPADELTRSVAIRLRSLAAQARSLRRTANAYRVEVHKKYAIAFACIVFVLVGAPVAVRFPRGGVGMVIAVSLGVFAVYWVGLIGGENLGDKGIVSPFWAMWAPNFAFLALGAWGLGRMVRTGATARGGGWDDLFWTVRTVLARPLVLARAVGRAGPGRLLRGTRP